ncbi:MAG: kinase/pyrophosphorylase [Desulfarculus sp.]|nr:kinase/pyrophosphorylase [Desulfarculus sp.]
MSPPKIQLPVHVVSDATGIAAERMARSVLVQFHKLISPHFIRHPFVKTTKDLRQVLDQAEANGGILAYTLVDKSLRAYLEREGKKRGIEMVDFLGPMLGQMISMFRVNPILDKGLLRRILGEASLNLAEAIEFTLRHDDGQGLETLGQADVIILGVSRTSKTPTSLYLSCNNNLKVANVPIILDMELPKKVFTLKKPHMVGLTIAPEKLCTIRRNRFQQARLSAYHDLATVNRELSYSHDIFGRIKGLQIIDVSNRSIEAVANLIA